MDNSEKRNKKEGGGHVPQCFIVEIIGNNPFL
jgi:hypothetical protein